MVKGVSAVNVFVKGAAMVTMVAGAVTLGNASAKSIQSQEKTAEQPTELVSNEGAVAIETSAMTPPESEVPSVHNKKLDEIMRKYVEDDEERLYAENLIKDLYETNGTFLGSALLQHEIDVCNLYAFITGNTNVMINNGINPELGRKIASFGADFYKTITPQKDSIANWMVNEYSQAVRNTLRFDHRPSAKEVDSKLGEIFRTEIAKTNEDRADYDVKIVRFISRPERNNKPSWDTQYMSDLIAYKMYLIDRGIFDHSLWNFGIFYGETFEHQGIVDYYNQWMDSVEPK